ncbi:uncharacterized protein MONOS_15542 [Monocercomonoides exilis]|uniref:uncharacterized protein n=1 Tax=Monocercomonoides exilis TaxID=2049356 RepID=UPI003559B847|nr:hypothetical protein MONOS_15542 [Monocercomonoides exilis]|eukprot:MONOS_15542.1-p1 / transcript=MONOS_15542.1 / gene=MONOS_15542 / organism=Monocercomonoides_exilis_PA203 / gene_product=unspecified product / transcript_product=unspecified product / location=Mono_scaffold01266:9730-10269(+) / protein_length=133 / sequence_SO=supercontig / SO=protein_coding / is_pseudo=false
MSSLFVGSRVQLVADQRSGCAQEKMVLAAAMLDGMIFQQFLFPKRKANEGNNVCEKEQEGEGDKECGAECLFGGGTHCKRRQKRVGCCILGADGWGCLGMQSCSSGQSRQHRKGTVRLFCEPFMVKEETDIG